jgi:hypothetical protein
MNYVKLDTKSGLNLLVSLENGIGDRVGGCALCVIMDLRLYIQNCGIAR